MSEKPNESFSRIFFHGKSRIEVPSIGSMGRQLVKTGCSLLFCLIVANASGQSSAPADPELSAFQKQAAESMPYSDPRKAEKMLEDRGEPQAHGSVCRILSAMSG